MPLRRKKRGFPINFGIKAPRMSLRRQGSSLARERAAEPTDQQSRSGDTISVLTMDSERSEFPEHACKEQDSPSATCSITSTPSEISYFDHDRIQTTEEEYLEEYDNAQAVTIRQSEGHATELLLPPLGELIVSTQQAYRASRELILCPEFRNLVLSSMHLLATAGDFALQTALFLPVTVPCHIVCKSNNLVRSICFHVVGQTFEIISKVNPLSSRRLLTDDKQNSDRCLDQSDDRKDNREQTEATGSASRPPALLAAALTLSPKQLVDAAGKLKDEVTNAVVQLVGLDRHKTVPSSTKRDDFLDRLRLDYIPPEESAEIPSREEYKAVQSAKTKSAAHSPSVKLPVQSRTSRMLLRVNDISIKTEDGINTLIYFIDLADSSTTSKVGGSAARKSLFTESLDRLVEQGLSFIFNNGSGESPEKISWKAEGTTNRLLQRMSSLSGREKIGLLRNETFVWSGKNGMSDTPFFLARGVVPLNPREMLIKLWDNSRTVEYNRFCLGRKTLLDLSEEDLLKGTTGWGAKVIESETRVPFTNLSVTLSCLMHARPTDNGYLVVSRSLQSGPAGTSMQPLPSTAGNEIVWGLNVMRAVPDHPQLTELLSLSQVQSPAVPKFLAQRIGLMGIEEFFKNVRQPLR